MKYKCEEKFTHLFYLYESWYESSDDQIWRTFSDRFYIGRASHLKRPKKKIKSIIYPNTFWKSERNQLFMNFEKPGGVVLVTETDPPNFMPTNDRKSLIRLPSLCNLFF